MDYKQLSVDTSADERGAFTALVSTWELDRDGECFLPGAFRRSLEQWRASGRTIPVLANHEGTVESVVGYIDPRLTSETAAGLHATGMLDFTTPLGERTYALVKANRVSWSVGFIPARGARRKVGSHVQISQADLCEVSVVPIPSNTGARTLSIKSAKAWRVVSFDC